MSSIQSCVPPGFRFHPTDEELVGYYLRKKFASQKIDLDVIKDLDLYRIEPWDIQEICRIGSEEQKEWYFFSHKDKKYPTGTRTNRATMAGFWKATWPKLSQIQNHVAIELALDETIQQLRARVVFSPSQIDLRLSNTGRPLSQGNRPFGKTTRFKAEPPSPLQSPTLFRSTAASQSRLKVPPVQITKPYLPTHPLRTPRRSFHCARPTDTFSSSTNLDDGSSTDGDDEGFFADTDTSDILSSPSPPSSPSSAMPTLWPSTRQLFPSASQPSTPSISSSLLGHRHISLLNLAMTASHNPTRQSSPEARYKRLFHSQQPGSVPSDSQREVDQTMQFGEAIPTSRQTGTASSAAPIRPNSSFHPDLVSGGLPTVIDASPTITASSSPRPGGGEMTSPVLTSKEFLMQESEDLYMRQRERRYSRRGSVQGAGLNLPLDISGTRGMMLRRKKSSRSINGTDPDVP